MEKIINPWKGIEGYYCFGCAPHNEDGLKMEFYEDGDPLPGLGEHPARGHTGHDARRNLCLGHRPQDADFGSDFPHGNALPEAGAYHRLASHAQGAAERSETALRVHRSGYLRRARPALHQGRMHLLPLLERKSGKGNVLQGLLYGKRGGEFIKLTAKPTFS